jgi:hypothetical protein
MLNFVAETHADVEPCLAQERGASCAPWRRMPFSRYWSSIYHRAGTLSRVRPHPHSGFDGDKSPGVFVQRVCVFTGTLTGSFQAAGSFSHCMIEVRWLPVVVTQSCLLRAPVINILTAHLASLTHAVSVELQCCALNRV